MMNTTMTPTSTMFSVGDVVEIFLNEQNFGQEGWFRGTIIRIDPYSSYRSFHWVQLDDESCAILGGRTRQVAVLNPRHMRHCQPD
jgi:hypothetical protein